MHNNLIQGNILDVNPKTIERALKRYDAQLYLKWNGQKRDGAGCWEVRRKSNKKTLSPQGEFLDGGLYLVEEKENFIINHVLDADILDYRILDRIKKMDTWGDKHWVTNFENEEERRVAEGHRKSREELKYSIKHNRKVLKDLKEMVASGANLGQILSKVKI